MADKGGREDRPSRSRSIDDARVSVIGEIPLAAERRAPFERRRIYAAAAAYKRVVESEKILPERKFGE